MAYCFTSVDLGRGGLRPRHAAWRGERRAYVTPLVLGIMPGRAVDVVDRTHSFLLVVNAAHNGRRFQGRGPSRI